MSKFSSKRQDLYQPVRSPETAPAEFRQEALKLAECTLPANDC